MVITPLPSSPIVTLPEKVSVPLAAVHTNVAPGVPVTVNETASPSATVAADDAVAVTSASSWCPTPQLLAAIALPPPTRAPPPIARTVRGLRSEGRREGDEG